MSCPLSSVHPSDMKCFTAARAMGIMSWCDSYEAQIMMNVHPALGLLLSWAGEWGDALKALVVGRSRTCLLTLEQCYRNNDWLCGPTGQD